MLRMPTGVSFRLPSASHRPKLTRAVSALPNEDDRFEQDWYKACASDSPLNMREKELREVLPLR